MNYYAGKLDRKKHLAKIDAEIERDLKQYKAMLRGGKVTEADKHHD